MGAMIHFDMDGWFARRDGDFTLEGVMRVAEAAARTWLLQSRGTRAYVAYDTREGAREAAEVAAAAIAGQGIEVILSDRYAPSPALSRAVLRDEAACGGLMVTGGHYPDDYLGIKLRIADGGVGAQEFFDALEELMEPEPACATGDYIEGDIVTPYLEGLGGLVDGRVISSASLSVVCDAMYGSGRGYLPLVLGGLGVQAKEIHGVDDGCRADLRPEAVEPWADDCEQAVEACEAVAGFIVDGDASLLGVVDEDGNYVARDTVAALILGHLVVNRGLSGRVACCAAASTMLRRVARALECRTAVRPLGFRSICEELRAGGVVMGTEDRGGICIPTHIYDRDAILACLLLCELMAETGMTIKALVSLLKRAVGSMSCGSRDLRLPAENVEMLRAMLPGINPEVVAGRRPVSVSRVDGLRFEFEDESWVLLRPSRTEPLVRVYAEAGTVEMRDAMLDAAGDIARLNPA